jgi:uncharacterized membrane-anchored protein
VTPLSAGWKLLCPIEYRGEHELDDPDVAQELVSQIRRGHAAANRPRVTRIVAAIQPDHTDWIRAPTLSTRSRNGTS